MTTSNDGSGIAQVPGASAAEQSAPEKKPRTRKSPATAKKTSTAKAKAAKASETDAPAAAQVAEAPAENTPAKKTMRKPAAAKPKKPIKAEASDVAAADAPAVEKTAPAKAKAGRKPASKPAGKASPDVYDSVGEAVSSAQGQAAETAAPKKPRATARKPRAAKAAPVEEKAGGQAEARPEADANTAAEDAPRDSKKSAPRRSAKTPARAVEAAVGSAANDDGTQVSGSAKEAGQAEQQGVTAQAGEGGEARTGSRRRRGSRGRGKGGDRQEAGTNRGDASRPEGEAARNNISDTDAPIALEAQKAPALPAGESQLALEAHEAPLAIDSGEQPKRNGRRRKRGKGNGNGNVSGVADEAAKSAAKPEEAVAEAKPAKAAKSKSKRKMFVSVLAGEQVEVVISEDGQLREYYVEMLHHAKIKGNIYKGVIHNVDPNLQAAFVSYGAVKNGFLQIDEVHPEYYLAPHESGKGHKYPLIQKVLKAGQEILVQVVKEPSGTKGAFLTSYLSLPGRFLVLTPGREQIGVSRKVGNDSERSRLRELLNGLNPGPGLGVIVRTVSEGASKTNLQKDLQSLKRIWRDVRKKGSSEPAPALIYQELGLAARAVRDYLTEDVIELWVNDEDMAKEISEVITMLFPKRKDILHLHDDSNQSLFERFGLARQISQVQSREVVLPSGGRLVFDQTEALMAIDINSGRTGGKSNFEDMAFKINLEAAQHIPLQLRLRDIGGQVVVDFIEMRDRGHWREVEKAFRNGMREDRARHDVGKISSFGLLEVVRQRLGSSAISIASEPCPFCKGTGIRRNMEWQALQAMQAIQQLIRQNNEPGKTLVYNAGAELVLYLLNSKKEWLLDMEQENNVKLELHPGL